MAFHPQYALYTYNPVSPNDIELIGGGSIDRDSMLHVNSIYQPYYSLEQMIQRELAIPPQHSGFTLLNWAIAHLQYFNMRIRCYPRQAMNGLSGQEEFSYVQDVLFINYNECNAVIDRYLDFPIPSCFLDVLNGTFNQTFCNPMGPPEYHLIAGYDRGKSCIVVPIPEKIPALEKVSWESALGANGVYQAQKLAMLSRDRTVGNGLGTSGANASKLRITVERNGRKFLFESESGDV